MAISAYPSMHSSFTISNSNIITSTVTYPSSITNCSIMIPWSYNCSRHNANCIQLTSRYKIARSFFKYCVSCVRYAAF